MIAAEYLSREFDGVKALDGVSLQVGVGETFGLIGPNGAGKTTLIRILTGQIAPSGGVILLQGEAVDPRDARYRLRVGLVPQEASFYGRLTARENLELLGGLYGLEKGLSRRRSRELLSWVGLDGDADRQVRDFSRGMQQRLSLAMGLVHRPQLVFLDEPTAGLDPSGKRSIWELVDKLSSEGGSVFLATHDMEEADRLCDRLAVLFKGIVREEGAPSYIKGLLGRDQLELRLSEGRGQDLDGLLAGLGLRWSEERDLVTVTGPDLIDKLPDILAGLPGAVRHVNYREVTLEDAFLHFMREVEG